MPSRNEIHNFAQNPEVHIERSRFDMDSNVKFTGNVGNLIPFYLLEVLPGDTFEIQTSLVCRLQTLIHPIMDNLFLDTYYFFVPNRLVWDHWKEFCGEPERAWTPAREYTIPRIKLDPLKYADPSQPGRPDWTRFTNYFKDSPLDYLGGAITPEMLDPVYFNALPIRAYEKVYDDWFRDENLIDPVNLYTGDDDVEFGVGNPDDGDIDVDTGRLYYSTRGGADIFKAAKLHDYFTSALPQPQRGDPVNVLGDVSFTIPSAYDPVYTRSTVATISGSEAVRWRFSDGSTFPFGSGSSNAATLQYVSPGAVGMLDAQFAEAGSSSSGYSAGVYPSNLWSSRPAISFGNDLSLTINDLRLAFQVQKFMEKSARGGARYIELIKTMFGVDSPDSRLQRSEYLGGHRIPLNIHQIVNQSETAETPLGNVGAMSLTSDSHNDFIHSFTEHGFIIGICVVRYKHSYSQGINRLWCRRTKFDYYWPVFANIGEQPIKTSEIYYQTVDLTPGGVFGYQEAWADYRYVPDRVAGEMRPGIPNTLASWHLGDYYDRVPTLSTAWIEESQINVDRTLAVTSQVSDQLLFDVFVKNRATRPMPVYSIPGLADHH